MKTINFSEQDINALYEDAHNIVDPNAHPENVRMHVNSAIWAESLDFDVCNVCGVSFTRADIENVPFMDFLAHL